MLRVGDILVPFIFMSDGTHLSNFACDKKKWFVYMTIGDLSSKIRQMPSTHSIIMVALLPILITNSTIHQKRQHDQQQTTWEILKNILRWVLQPLTFKQNPSAKSVYYNILCADGYFSGCKHVLAAWLADCPEYSDLHHLERHVCFWCPKNELGEYVPPDKQHPQQDHNLYRTLRDANTIAADTEQSSRNVHRAFNACHHIPCIISDLPRPTFLHTMQIGKLDHL